MFLPLSLMCYIVLTYGGVGGHLHVWPDLTVQQISLLFPPLSLMCYEVLTYVGVGGHLHVWPGLTVSADLSFVSTFIFDMLHSSDICWDRCWVGMWGGTYMFGLI